MSARSWLPWRVEAPDDLAPPVDLPSGLDRPASDGKVLSGYVRLDAPDFERLVTRANAAEERARSAEELLFENGAELSALTKQLDELNRENVELQQALDVRRPAADPAVLGPMLAGEFHKRWPSTSWNPGEAWNAIAETAIDHVRGLWPLDEPAFHGPSCTCEIDGPDGHGLCTADRPTDVAGSSEVEQSPSASWAGEPPAPGDPNLARAADEQIEALAQVIAERQLAAIGNGWDGITDPLREHFRHVAGDVVMAGWRPPVGSLVPTSRVTAAAQVLYDHESVVDADTTCRCGWDGAPIHHVEHVAEQLVALAVVA